MKTLLLCAVLIAASPLLIKSQQLHLYSDVNKTTYLGCLTCSKYAATSIWNEYGKHGSQYNSYSVWNKFGIYGSPFNSQSPWNEYSSYPPVIIDEAGTYLGYFTRNRNLYGRTRDQFAVWVLDNYEMIRDNFSEIVDKMQ